MRGMDYGGLKFGSLDEVINIDDLESFGQDMEWLDQSKRAFKEGFGLCLEQGKTKGKKCSSKTIMKRRQ